MTQLWLRFGFTCAKMASKSLLVVFKVKESGALKKTQLSPPGERKNIPCWLPTCEHSKRFWAESLPGADILPPFQLKKKLGVKNAYISTPLM